ncbi:SpoIIAA-like protein [Gelidibacter sediminis]|jgi:hypothetical protein|uniref:SpoIIAA-like n=3 Tax=Flavobacteriaceae TaxID=49546 RepID=A0A1H3WEP8_BIZPA|nr:MULTISPECIES: STAS/SEC14 domain-containing protein [Flavobacteriaceae]MCK0125158.1 STAS/SEC14 domain-containing protein [Gelidibacter sp. F2691]MCK0157968.1 STAS/SEC14 domain-containing protein [Cellulophaga sp. F20128]TDU33772.1 SpoIIAA-like protein [Gelidibacter sediminis]SDZ85440.1 SpoIIAA-like [Bizionia paragorgiae]
MIQFVNSKNENLIAAKLEGKISTSDVELIHSRIDEILNSNQKVDFYFEMHDFHGYDLQGLWADIKVDNSHLSDYGKMAFVGERKWQEWAAKATDFFTGSEVRYFDLKDKEQAKQWINL